MKLTLTIFLFFCVFGVKAQTISTYGGNGLVGNTGDGGAATAAKINYPTIGVFDKSGNYYFTTGTNGNSVRKISSVGIITTIAGGGSVGAYTGDGGPASVAKFNNPQGIAIDGIGNLYISDAQNNAIRKINAITNIITTIAGKGGTGYSGDGGPSTAALLNNPNGICINNVGDIYFADYGNFRIRKINTSGVISSFAGTGVAGFNGDGGLADTSMIRGALDVCADQYGNIYIADEANYRVRKVNSAGIIQTVAGNGVPGFSGDGSAATAAQVTPHTVTCDMFGNIFFADIYIDRVRVITSGGIINTIAGTGKGGYSGDGGPSTAAMINGPAGLTTDFCGNLYICEVDNRRIRKVSSGTTIIPTISITSGTSFASGSTVKVTAAVTDTCASYLVRWFNKGVLFATTTTTSVTYTKGAGIDTITARVVPQCGSCYDSATSLKHIVYNTALGIGGVGVQPVRVYPNPAQSELTIAAGTKITGVTISNIIGRQVYSHEYNTENVTLNIAQLPAGVYTLKITGEGWQEVRRVVKE